MFPKYTVVLLCGIQIFLSYGHFAVDLKRGV